MNINRKTFSFILILPFLMILLINFLPVEILVKEVLIILLGLASILLMVYGYRKRFLSRIFIILVISGAVLGFLFVMLIADMS